MSKLIGGVEITSKEVIIRSKTEYVMGTSRERVVFVPEDAILEMGSEVLEKGKMFVGGNNLKKIIKICLYVEQNSCTMCEGDVYSLSDEEIKRHHNEWQRDFNTEGKNEANP